MCHVRRWMCVHQRNMNEFQASISKDKTSNRPKAKAKQLIFEAKAKATTFCPWAVIEHKGSPQ